MGALTFLNDARLVISAFIALLGVTAMLNASPRSWRWVRWLGGAGVLLGLAQAAFRSLEIARPIDAAVAGPAGTLVGMAAVASLTAGIQAFCSPASREARVFWAILVGGSAWVLLAVWASGGWAFAAPLGTAVLLAGIAGWLVRLWRRERWSGLLLLAGAMMLHPLTLALALAHGLTLQAFRDVVVVPVALLFVLVVALIMQRDARQLALELQQREQAERALQLLTQSLEETVQERTRKLEQIVQGLQSFAGMLSHDLRGPLGNLVMLSDLAARSMAAGDTTRTRHWLGMVQQEARRTVSMVNDLLVLARAEQGVLKREPVDLDLLARRCLDGLALTYPPARDCVTIDPLPTVAADPGLMHHVLHNLIGNALKFGRATPGLRVRLSAAPAGDGWRFEVSDNGPGFPPTRAGELFQPFARLAGKHVDGTGLGLSIVRRIVERHGGAVGAEAEPGRGARFWWTLPAAGA